MKQLLILLFIMPTIITYAQNEQPKDSLKKVFPTETDKEGYIVFPLKEVILPKPPQTAILPTADSIYMKIPSPVNTFQYPWMSSRIRNTQNPYSMDYARYNTFLLSPKSIFSTSSTYETYPTMGTIIQAEGTYTFRPNNRWDISGGIYTTKYTMPSRMHGSHPDVGLNATAAYRINDRLRIRLFGQYSAFGQHNATFGYMNPMYPQSNFGGIMELKINDYLEIHGGMERVYSPEKMKWITVPVLYPVINLKGKK